MIEVKNLWKSYDDNVVLENFNLTVKEGEFVTLVGASGCGKSTFLNLLLGTESPTWVFDKVRHDPHSPESYGATITYDLSVGNLDQSTYEKIDNEIRPVPQALKQKQVTNI